VAPRLEHPRSLRPPRSTATRTRPLRPSLPAPVRAAPAYRPSDPPPQPIDEPTALPDRGLELIVAFVAAVFVMVAMAVVVGMVDAGWILIPVMAVDFAVTAGVLTMVVRLLNDGDGS
jgi:hypothetical protein